MVDFLDASTLPFDTVNWVSRCEEQSGEVEA